MGKNKKLLPALYNSPSDCLDYVAAMGGFDEPLTDFYDLAKGHEIGEADAPKAAEAAAQPKERPGVRKLSPFDMSRRLLRVFHIRNICGALYAYEPPLFAPAKFDRIAEMLQNILTDEELSRLNMADFKGVYECLFTDSSIKIAEIPIHPGCVLFENGYVNIITRERLESSPEAICLTQIGAQYEWGEPSETPVFDEFLNTSTGGDVKTQKLILAFMGYSLIPDQGGKCFFVLGTAPNSGKSVLAAFLQRLVGDDVVSSVSLNDIHNSFALTPLVGEVLNLSMDLNSDYLNGRAVSAIKMLTGGDTVTINEKYMPMFSYRNVAKFIFATNSPVLLKKPDDAFWERMVIVPFIHSVDKTEQDKELLDKLWGNATALSQRR